MWTNESNNFLSRNKTRPLIGAVEADAIAIHSRPGRRPQDTFIRAKRLREPTKIHADALIYIVVAAHMATKPGMWILWSGFRGGEGERGGGDVRVENRCFCRERASSFKYFDGYLEILENLYGPPDDSLTFIRIYSRVKERGPLIFSPPLKVSLKSMIMDNDFYDSKIEMNIKCNVIFKRQIRTIILKMIVSFYEKQQRRIIIR